MDNWKLEQTATEWRIRGSDGRTVGYVQYERDARFILDAVKAAQNTTLKIKETQNG